MKTDARKDAVKYLAVRARSEAEVKAHLLKHGHDEESIKIAMEDLKERGLLGDEALSKSWAAELATKGRSGRTMALHKLMERGIPKDLAEASVESVWSEVDEGATASNLLQKRLRAAPARLNDRNEIVKSARFLRSRGYGTEAISKALREVFGREE